MNFLEIKESTDISVAIFAGGQSSRMGQDKAQLAINGFTLLELMARTALEVSSDVLVVGRDEPVKWPYRPVTFLPDDEPGLGPLGALQTVLYERPAVLVVACDLPLLQAGGLRWLMEQNKTRGKQGIIVQNGEQWEPLFSIYHASCLHLIDANLAAGRRSMHALIKAGDFAFATAPPEIQRQLVNVNTPEEWAALMQAGD